MTDLLARCAELVDIPSVSHHETAMADHLEAQLRQVSWLDVERVGDNVVARTKLGREQRLVLAGHIDTVPPNGNERSRVDGDVLWGLGSADMKAGVAVFLELARALPDTTVDVTYVFYVCEEVEQKHNGLVHLLEERPDLLACDAAILGEPTGALIEAGCQGAMRVDVTLVGERSHSARPWMGINAIHRLADVLARVSAHEGRQPVIDGCEFREALQAVRVEGFVAYNVVPDRAEVVLNHRFAPDRTTEEAFAAVRDVLGEALDEGRGDTFVLHDCSVPAPPSLDHPLLRSLVESSGQPPRAKLGWTDVSFFAQHGIPATNFGPGEPNVAHSAREHVERGQIESVYRTLSALLSN